jgi:hypothetical protein
MERETPHLSAEKRLQNVRKLVRPDDGDDELQPEPPSAGAATGTARDGAGISESTRIAPSPCE